MANSKPRLLLFIGSYAEPSEPGIHVYELDSASGKMALLSEVSGIKNPTFLSVDGVHRKLYAISETKNGEGARVGTALSFSIDPALGQLSGLSQTETIKPSTSHIQRDDVGCYLVVSGYHGGNVGLIKLNEDATTGELTDEKLHAGHSVNPERQDRPHPHSALFSPDNRFVLVADLGLDLIRVYELNQTSRTLIHHSDVLVPPGSGPRHLAFHPNGRLLYCINEINSTISVFAYEPDNGRFEIKDTVSTLPAGFTADNYTAEIAVSGDGRYLYGSNRGHESIVQFAVDQSRGKLTYVGHVSVQGAHPRHFALTPDGEYLIAANRDSNNLVLFKVDKESGKLTFTGETASLSKPVCVKPVMFDL